MFTRLLRSVEETASDRWPQPGLNVADVEAPNGLPPLPGLALGETRVTGEGLRHLEGLARVRRLVLHGASVTDDGLAHLSKMTGLEVLRSLNLRDTKGTEKGMADLGKILPKARIVR